MIKCRIPHFESFYGGYYYYYCYRLLQNSILCSFRHSEKHYQWQIDLILVTFDFVELNKRTTDYCQLLATKILSICCEKKQKFADWSWKKNHKISWLVFGKKKKKNWEFHSSQKKNCKINQSIIDEFSHDFMSHKFFTL